MACDAVYSSINHQLSLACRRYVRLCGKEDDFVAMSIAVLT